MAKTGTRKTPARKLPLKKGHYRRAYYVQEKQLQQLKTCAAIGGREQSEIVQEALDEYFANHPEQLKL